MNILDQKFFNKMIIIRSKGLGYKNDQISFSPEIFISQSNYQKQPYRIKNN